MTTNDAKRFLLACAEAYANPFGAHQYTAHVIEVRTPGGNGKGSRTLCGRTLKHGLKFERDGGTLSMIDCKRCKKIAGTR